MTHAIARLSRGFIGMLCLLLTACSARTVVPVGEIPSVPPPSPDQIKTARALVENEMGVPIEAMQARGSGGTRARNIVDRLARAANYGNTKIPVYVVDADDDVNAMAVNGGAIVVFTKLIDRVPDDNQLAAVLGHEVAHMLTRHHEDEGEAEREVGVSLFSTVLGSAAAVAVSVATGSEAAGDLVGDVTGTASEVIGQGAIVKAYSRDMEYEADHVGLMIMTKAGYDPHAAITFWENANEIFGEDLSGSSFLSTHPSGPERIEALREALPYAEKYRKH